MAEPKYKIYKQFIPTGQPGDPSWAERDIYVLKIISGSYTGSNEVYDSLQEVYLGQDQLAQADEFILNFESGYNTLVGERGVTLSGGQKQRIAFARALLVDPTILVLDDASSAIDAETERKIQTAIANVLKNRTTFIITHRLATIKNADIIIVLRNGSLIDSGTHAELILRNIDYRNLFEKFSELPPLKTEEVS